MKPLLTASEAAQLLNVPASWLLAKARGGQVPHHRLGRYVRFAEDELTEWLAQTKAGPNGRRPDEDVA